MYIIEAMFRRGVMPDPDSRDPFFTCAAHTDEDADFTLGAFEEAVKEAHGEDMSITCIGPAGELQLSAASIQTTDMDGYPCRAAGRGGLGAVMGSKGLKAIVVEKNAKKAAPIHDIKAFKDSAKIFAQAVIKDEASIHDLPVYLNLSSERLGMIYMDGRCLNKKSRLKDGARIKIFQPIAGG